VSSPRRRPSSLRLCGSQWLRRVAILARVEEDLSWRDFMARFPSQCRASYNQAILTFNTQTVLQNDAVHYEKTVSPGGLRYVEPDFHQPDSPESNDRVALFLIPAASSSTCLPSLLSTNVPFD
jgi:hypothetical protein